jgi:hypothetical protein
LEAATLFGLKMLQPSCCPSEKGVLKIRKRRFIGKLKRFFGDFERTER